MNRPTVDEILLGLEDNAPEDDRPNRYTAAMVVARRARQINSYFRSLGEGGGALEEVAPPLVTAQSRNYLTVAMEEAAQGEIGYRWVKR